MNIRNSSYVIRVFENGTVTHSHYRAKEDLVYCNMVQTVNLWTMDEHASEEATLLRIFREVDPEAHNALIRQVFCAFDNYDNGPDRIEYIYEELLKLLS